MVHSLAKGTLVTVEVTALAAVVGVLLSLVAGSLRSANSRLLRLPAAIYVEVFRGSSALAQLYFIFFALPLVGVTFSPLVAGVLGLGLNFGSYGAEVVRGALRSVPVGQREAAVALNLPPATRFFRVILPSAVPVMLPSLNNMLIDLLKNSALVSTITISELTFQGTLIRENTGATLSVFAILFVIYFALSSVIDAVMRLAERRSNRALHSPVRTA